MQLARPAFAPDPRLFGRRAFFDLSSAPLSGAQGFSADLKLFVTTFLVGFLFVSVLIA
jgi:hypothetical protein